MRFKVEYGQGFASSFVDLSTGVVWSYGPDIAVELHALYGGKHYYRSLSGRSGAGYLEEGDTLLEIGAYRPNTRFEQRSPDGPGRDVFVPILDLTSSISHWPIVGIRRPDEVHFLLPGEVKPFLCGQPRQEGGLRRREVKIRSYDSSTGAERVKVTNLIRPDYYGDFRFPAVARFMDIPLLRIEDIPAPDGQDMTWSLTTGFIRLPHGWYWRHPLGYLAEKLAGDPREAGDGTIYSVEAVPLPWQKVGRVFWKRTGDVIQEVFPNGNVAETPILDYYSREYLVRDRLRSAEGIITREAILALGACPEGVDDFVRDFQIPEEGIAPGALAEHFGWRKMVEIPEFLGLVRSWLDR